MNLDQLIKDLCDDINETSPAQVYKVSHGLSIFVMVLLTIPPVLALGPRSDLWNNVSSQRFCLELLLSLILSIIIARVTLASAIPGRITQPNKVFMLLAVLFAGFMLSALRLSIPEPRQLFQFDPLSAQATCIAVGMALAVLPALWLFFKVKRGFPTNLRLTGALILMAAGVVATAGMSFTCPSGQDLHLAVFHILPVLAYALLGFFLGPKLLKW